MIVAAEVCKKRLTENEDTTYKYIFRRKTHMVKVKRSLFEELTADLVQQTIDLMKKAIEMAKLKVGNPDLKLDEIILVGGSSHMPMIRKRILKEYPHINIRLDRFEPDLAIAKGAALYAAGNVKIEDMGTRSYGTSIRSAADKNKNVVVNIIYKTDPMVVEKSSTFYTAHPKQTSALIDVYENEGLDGEIELKKCKLLREDSLEWGYPVDAGTQIDMVLSRGTDGILKVFGKCEGKVVQFEIKADQALSRQEAQEWRERLDSQTF